jgi:hypothetical protein
MMKLVILLNLPLIRKSLEAIKNRWPVIKSFNLHLHNTRGMALTSSYVAMRSLDATDTLRLQPAIGGMGGCPFCGNGQSAGLAPTEDLIHMMEGMGIVTGVDLARFADQFAKHRQLPKAVFMIWDEAGTVFYRYPDNDKWFGHMVPAALRSPASDGTTIISGMDGIARVYGTAVLSAYPDVGISISVGAAEAELVQLANSTLRRSLILLGLVAGIGGGILLALLLNALDFSLNTVDQVEEYLKLPVLSAVPRFQTKAENVRLIQTDSLRSSEAESFRTLRTALSMLGRKEDRRTFLFTSALPAEGKLKLALVIAFP